MRIRIRRALGAAVAAGAAASLIAAAGLTAPREAPATPPGRILWQYETGG